MSRNSLLVLIIGVVAVIVAGWISTGRDAEPDHKPDHRPDTIDAGSAVSMPQAEQQVVPPDAEPAAPDAEHHGREVITAQDMRFKEDDIDWLNIDDVDRLYDELAARHEQGDIHAAYLLARLIRQCQAAPRFMNAMERDPSFLQRMDKLHVISAAIQVPCADSRLGDAGYAQDAHDHWFWEAAISGHPQAAWDIAFEGMGSTSLAPPQFGVESEADSLALRQAYAEQLSETCFSPGFESIGDHLSRGSERTATLPPLGGSGGSGQSERRPVEGFAYRYAAAYIAGHGRPEHAARRSDYPLTPAEENDALRMGQGLIARCP